VWWIRVELTWLRTWQTWGLKWRVRTVFCARIGKPIKRHMALFLFASFAPLFFLPFAMIFNFLEIFYLIIKNLLFQIQHFMEFSLHWFLDF
jgi:hypothetical protein